MLLNQDSMGGEAAYQCCLNNWFMAPGHNLFCSETKCDATAGSWAHVPPAAPGRPGYEAVPPGQRVSSCTMEAGVPWRALQALTPDATQLAPGAAWAPQPYMCAIDLAHHA